MVNQEDVAFEFPSISSEDDSFITLKNGKQYRAKHLREHVCNGDHELITAIAGHLQGG